MRNQLKSQQKNSQRSSGTFLTFEGGEGAGKTTLIQSLAKALEKGGHTVVVTREPGGTLLGEMIREWVLHRDDKIQIDQQAEMLLFLAARVQHLDELILPALASGKIVLCDRFNDSTVAYQGGGRELGIDSTQQLCNKACRGIQPDKTFFLDLDPQVGLQRRRNESEEDRIEVEAKAFHERVRAAFHTLAKQDPQRIQIIDAAQSPTAVFEEALQTVQSLLQEI